ncbi:MAG: hypothetical protein MRZ79_27100 [Bacteroidia bacterium]|nr:hypothetical protein [Bacteroidia bacterium]
MIKQSIIRILVLLSSSLMMLSCGTTVNGYKNVRIITVERELPFPVDTVWNTIFMNYGDVAKFNPGAFASGYLGDVHEAVVGAERFIQNDEEGKEVIHERIVHIDAAEKIMRFQIFEAQNVPIDLNATFGESRLIELDSERSLFRLKFHYRTSPRVLALFAHGSLKKDFTNMTIGIEHYLTTKEAVGKENFAEIASRYK